MTTIPCTTEEELEAPKDQESEQEPLPFPKCQPRAARNRLSVVSKAYDRGNKGYLDDFEKRVRSYDTDNDGQISIEEVFHMVSDIRKEERKNRSLKKFLLLAISFGLLLCVAMFGMTWAVVVLTRQITVNGNTLVDSKTGM
jgi:nitrate reductase NapE component